MITRIQQFGEKMEFLDDDVSFKKRLKEEKGMTDKEIEFYLRKI